MSCRKLQMMIEDGFEFPEDVTITKGRTKFHEIKTEIKTEFPEDYNIGKNHALKKSDQFALNTSCFWGSTGSNITPVFTKFLLQK